MAAMISLILKKALWDNCTFSLVVLNATTTPCKILTFLPYFSDIHCASLPSTAGLLWRNIPIGSFPYYSWQPHSFLWVSCTPSRLLPTTGEKKPAGSLWQQRLCGVRQGCCTVNIAGAERKVHFLHGQPLPLMMSTVTKHIGWGQ